MDFIKRHLVLFIIGAAIIVAGVPASIVIANSAGKSKEPNGSTIDVYGNGNTSSSSSTSSSTSTSTSSSSSTTSSSSTSSSSSTTSSSNSSSSTSSSSSSEAPEEDYEPAYAPTYYTPPDYVQTDFRDLYSVNPDIVGWISIGNWLDRPVMQSDDNEYYLTHDFYGNYSRMGSLYVNSGVKVTENGPTNTIIYGHNDAGGSFFGGLPEYFNYSVSTGNWENISFYKNNPVVTYNTIYKNSRYKIFAGILVNVYEEDGTVFPYHTARNFGGKSDFDNFVANVLDRSTFINPDVDIQYGDRLLTLSTCMWGYGTPSLSESYDAHLRWVIFAREVRDGESASVDVSRAYANPDPLFHDAYYYNYAGGSWGGRKWPREIIKDFAG
ncbi:MAG: class B sortase [Ruminococcaceae bacterium]|nr:class B sortase [Oscillospiraceae bacterium]